MPKLEFLKLFRIAKHDCIFSAIRFLTIIPVPLSWCGDEQSFNRSPDWYPLTGLAIGLIMAACDLLFRWLLPLPVAGVLVVVGLIAISGALHMDGLADTADAFFSSRGRERMLEIMKDSSAGPMGVTAIVVVLLLKTALILSLPPAWRTETIILMPLAGRCVMPMISSWIPMLAVPKEPVLYPVWFRGQTLCPESGWNGSVFDCSARLGIGAACCGRFSLLSWLMGRYSRRKIGGFTGDTLGATCELIEMVPALCVIVLAHQGVI